MLKYDFGLQVYVPQMNTVPQMNKIENSTLEMSTTNLSLGIDNMTKMVQKQWIMVLQITVSVC